MCNQLTHSSYDDYDNTWTLFIIIIKPEVRPICHCLWLGHETMVYGVCFSIFLCIIHIYMSIFGELLYAYRCVFEGLYSLSGNKSSQNMSSFQENAYVAYPLQCTSYRVGFWWQEFSSARWKKAMPCKKLGPKIMIASPVISAIPVVSLTYKGSVMWKTFPCHKVIMPIFGLLHTLISNITRIIGILE